MTLGLTAIHPMLAMAPKLTDSHPLLQELNEAASLDSLYQLRDRIQTDLSSLPKTTNQDTKRLDPYYTLAQLTQRVTQRIQGEKQAETVYRRALELANQAMTTRQSGDGSLQALQQEEFLWQAAIDQLATIPEDSIQAEQAEEKIAQYRRIVEPVAKKVDRALSEFLEEIAEDTGQSSAIRISLCHELGECRDYQGDVPPESPASLIKLPVAVALMQRVTDEGIDLDEEIYIDPHNFTE
ncbi:MAG: serine hydrolase, partial [Cyanobacteria bacterium Co-bin8]|nr:serine hydrolase [Cyanobacteria bacterium Co-bin8]